MITTDQGDSIRQAHYVMDGASDRPKTTDECHAMIEGLLELLGAITGITNAGVVGPDEETMKDWLDREARFAIDAHEMTPGLTREVETILYGESMVEDADDDRYRRAAQLIACRRMTCGGPNLGHKHIS